MKRLHESITTKEKGTIVKDLIYTKYLAECKLRDEVALSKVLCGKILCSLFKVESVQIRNNGKNTWAYRGVTWKAEESTDISTKLYHFKLEDTLNQKPDSFIVFNRQKEFWTYGEFTGYLINGVRQTKEVTFRTDGTWQLSVGCTAVDPSIIGIGHNVIDNAAKIQMVFDLVSQSKLCRGQLLGNNSTCKIAELWKSEGCETTGEKRVRTLSCTQVLPFSSSSNTCRACQTGLWRERQQAGSNICKGDTLTQARNTQQREKQEKNHIEPKDTDEIADCLAKLLPGASPELKTLLLSQRKCLLQADKDARGRRWDKSIIQACLTLWNRSPQAYEQLKNSGFLFLPSSNLLQRHKNLIKQKPGLNTEVLEWMSVEADKQNASRCGGVIFDEMSIQQDLTIEVEKEGVKLCGLVDTGPECDAISVLMDQTHEAKAATHILQFIYLDYSGFRFPFLFYPTAGVNANHVFMLFWRSLQMLTSWDFVVDYTCMDGANCNRTFMHLMLSGRDIFSVKNIFNPAHEITLLMDYSHVIKRVRNNIFSSGPAEKHTRLMELAGKEIVWKHWEQAFFWDRSVNPVRIHPNLLEEHIFLSTQTKMRNHLAEQVLDSDMLNLMCEYKKSKGNEGIYLDSSIKLLQNTSKLVEFFRDARPISSVSDDRLKVNQDVLNWFLAWESEIKSSGGTAAEKNRKLMSHETRDDVVCLLRGFQELVVRRLNKGKGSIIPAGINSDVVENMFAQQRATHHGANTNPTVYQYKKAVNASILGAKIVSKKSNASSTNTAAQPVNFVSKRPLNPRKPLTSLTNIQFPLKN